MESLKDFLGREFVGPTYIIGPELLPVGGKLFLAAPEKHNKSFALLNMSLCLASGRPLWGAPELTISRRWRVGYFDQELGARRLQKRLARLTASEPDDDLRDVSFYVQPRDRDFRFDTGEGLRRIEEVVKENRLDVALFDPISKFYPGYDENDTRAMSILALNQDKLIANTGLSLVYAHHMPKPSEFSRQGAQRMRGSTVLAADLDTYVELARLSPAHAKEQTMAVSFVTRDQPLEPIYIKRLADGRVVYLGKANPYAKPDKAPETYETEV